MKFRSSLYLSMIAALLGTCGSGLAQDAQSYPDKPVRIIVPNAPGGTSDVLARSIGQKLTEMWGQQILVDNRPGAGGNIGAGSGRSLRSRRLYARAVRRRHDHHQPQHLCEPRL